MKVVVTGSAGMLGEHMLHHLRAAGFGSSDVVAVDRSAFSDDGFLSKALDNCDVVVHLAGINRASDEDLERGNIEIASRLVGVMKASNTRPHLVYSNTLHESADNSYGRGKRGAHACFSQWANSEGAKYSELILPHVFGEFGKPFYNSGVHTFCHQLVNNEQPEINPDGQFSLLHAGDVAEQVLQVIRGGSTGRLVLKGETITVPEVVGRLQSMYESYTNNVIPAFTSRLNLQLFNVLRSFMYPDYYPVSLTLHTDNRGSLFEAVKTGHGGQAFLSTTKPGITRGNHFHFEKIERFLVVSGEAVIRIRRLGTDDVKEFHVSGETPCFVDMPTLHTHSITNTGDSELLTMFWSHEIFDPEKPDTYAEMVIAQE